MRSSIFSSSSSQRIMRFDTVPLLASLQDPIKALQEKRETMLTDAKTHGSRSLDAKKSAILTKLDNEVQIIITKFNTEMMTSAQPDLKKSTQDMIHNLYLTVLRYAKDEKVKSILMQPRNSAKYHGNLILHVGVLGGTAVLCIQNPFTFLGLASGLISAASLPFVYCKGYLTDSMFKVVNLLSCLFELRHKLQQELQGEATVGPTYYDILGVEHDASNKDIKKAYLILASTYHPDKPTGNQELFIQVDTAYKTLSNPALRQEYDKKLEGWGISVPHRTSTFRTKQPHF